MGALADLAKHTYAMFRPPKHQTVSEWADENRVLVSESSAEPGPWRTDRAPYQREIMDAFTQAGVWQIVIMASAQVGKALDIRTPIATPDGWATMESLKRGDRVFDENGKPCTVTASTEIMYGRTCYEVVFSDGNRIVADAEHRWSVDCADDHGARSGRKIKTTAEIAEHFHANGRNLYSIPTAKPIQCGKRKLPIPPYTLGAWLGGAGRKQHIPSAYLRTCEEERFALLQGLMDTDGSAMKNGRCEITLVCRRLAFDVSELLHSLGIKHTVKRRETVCVNNGARKIGSAWRISFLAYSDQPIFSFARKQGRMKARDGKTRTGETESRRIVCVRKVESRPVKCIAVDSESRLYLAGKAMIPTHNSEIELNMMGAAIDNDPGPMLYIQPTDKVAEDYSKRRIAPMIAGCPTLKAKVYKAKGRDAANTITMKTFPGGSLAIIGANSPSDLSSKPVRYIFMDETDRFPASAGTEGDPQELAERRTETFRGNRKIVKTSTPTIKGASKIEKDFLSGTQEEWHVECPHCRQYNFIRFENILFEKEEFSDDKGQTDYRVTRVTWRCPVCKRETEEFATKRLPAKWVAKNPKAIDNGIRSFRLNAFMSPWSDWKDLILKFLKAKDDPEKLKVFHNTMLGESWETKFKNDADKALYHRREHYEAEVPDGVLVLTMGVDTQDNRLEYEIVGWDRNEQSWGISRGVIPGRADAPGVWEEIDALLDREWKMKNGMRLRVLASFIDSGGHFTQEIYKECAKRQHRRVFAIKGEGGEGKPYCREMKRTRKSRESIKFIIGVDSGKEAIMYAAGVEEAGARYMHFPLEQNAGYDREFFRGLISERMVIHRRAGQSVVAWEKVYDRNEPLDCRNYARAAYKYFRWNFDDFECVISGKPKPQTVTTRREAEKKKRKTVVSSGIKI